MTGRKTPTALNSSPGVDIWARIMSWPVLATCYDLSRLAPDPIGAAARGTSSFTGRRAAKSRYGNLPRRFASEGGARFCECGSLSFFTASGFTRSSFTIYRKNWIQRDYNSEKLDIVFQYILQCLMINDIFFTVSSLIQPFTLFPPCLTK